MDAFLFDMDGLMLDTQRLAHQALKEAALDEGFAISQTHCDAVRGLNERETVLSFQEQLGIALDEARFLSDFHSHYERLLCEGIVTKEGLIELLDLLELRKLPKAVATSTGRERAIGKLTSAGVIGRFSVIVGGDEVRFGKPAPDIFLLAAERLGVEPANCYVLEDADSGVEAAYAAGMRPIMIPDGNTPSEDSRSRAVKIYHSLNEVRELIG